MIIDDREARNEAKEMGLKAFLAYTSDILKQAEAEKIIDSYQTIREELQKVNIFIPVFDYPPRTKKAVRKTNCLSHSNKQLINQSKN